jgi:C4-dicarboxylate transporter DctQ subunit
MEKLLDTIGDILYKISGVIISVLLAGIVIFTFAEVISRYFFHFSIVWSQELTIFSLIWLVYLGCAMGMRRDEVVCLTVVYDRLPAPGQMFCRLVSNILLLLFMVICTIANQELIKFGMAGRTPITGIKRGFMAMAFSVSAVIIALNCLLLIIRTVKEFSACLKEWKKS